MTFTVDLSCLAVGFSTRYFLLLYNGIPIS